MHLREAVASALHLLVVLAFFTFGGFFVLLAHRSDWMEMVLDCLNKTPEALYWIAAGFGFTGLFFLWGFHGIGRGRYLSLEMNTGIATVDSKLIRQAIEECFKKNYPEQIFGASVSVSKDNRLKIALDLKTLPEEEQLTLLSDAEGKLRDLLQSRFAYHKPLALFVRSR